MEEKNKDKMWNNIISNKNNKEEQIKNDESNQIKLSLEEIITQYKFLKKQIFFSKKHIKKCFKNGENLNLTKEDRNKLWLILSSVNETIEMNEGYYSDLKEFSKKYSTYFSKMIELDVPRTLNAKKMSNEEKEILQEKITEILSCYSCRNPYIGYCQGMNFIVGYLIKKDFANDESFWLFSHLMESVLPLDYYTRMVSLMVDQKIFSELITIYLSDVQKKFKDVGLDANIFTLQWFVCMFVCTLNENIVDVIWDYLLLDGYTVFFKAGITILILIKDAILEVQDFGELLLVIEEKSKGLSDVKNFIQKFQELKISKSIIHYISENYYTLIKNDLEKSNKASSYYVKSHSDKCDPTSPVCSHLLEKYKNKKERHSFFIYRQAFSPNIIPDYFKSEKLEIKIKNEKNNEIINLNKQLENNYHSKIENYLVVGRQHHICYSEKKMRKVEKKNRIIEFESHQKYDSNEEIQISEKSKGDWRSESEEKKNLENRKSKKKKLPQTNNQWEKESPALPNQNKKKSKINDLFSILKGSFCINNTAKHVETIIVKPHVVHFRNVNSCNNNSSPLTPNIEKKNIYEESKLNFIAQELGKHENKNENENYENYLSGLLSPLHQESMDEKLKQKLNRSESICFNQQFLDKKSPFLVERRTNQK